jgi:thiol-disulfide isomerase/thioredoxin
MGGKVRQINAEQFDREVLGGGTVVVDFFSTECAPCEAVAPKYEGVSELYGEEVRFLKIFRQENRQLAETLGVTSSPTLLFYQGGTEKGQRLTGAVKRSEIVRMWRSSSRRSTPGKSVPGSGPSPPCATR